MAAGQRSGEGEGGAMASEGCVSEYPAEDLRVPDTGEVESAVGRGGQGMATARPFGRGRGLGLCVAPGSQASLLLPPKTSVLLL